MVEEIHSEQNRLTARWKERTVEWAAVIIATLALFVVILSFGMSILAVYISNQADDQIMALKVLGHEELLALEAELREDLNHERTSWAEQSNMTQAYIFSLKSKMVEHGLEVPEQEK
jgi:hypothetical protein